MFHRKWKKSDQAKFLIHVGQCLEKGYTLSEAIRMQTYEQPQLIKKRVAHILNDLKSGLPVAEVFQKAGFPQVSSSFLFFSVQTGQLSVGFLEGGRYLELKEAQKNKLSTLMRYPLFLIWIFALMVYMVVGQLLPSFKQLYIAMSIDLPLIVQLLLSIPSHLGTLLTILLMVIGLLTLFVTIYLRQFSVQQRLTHLVKLPFLSPFLKMYLSYYFAFHFGGLLKVGLSVNEALKLIQSQGFQPFFQTEAETMREMLVHGYALSEIIGQRLYYTNDLPMVIINGEAQGHLGRALQEYSHILFNRLEEKMTQVLGLIQPAFFILFGGLIVGLFLSILTPMFAILKGL